jgi:glycosyltransferase involved in cell wall biosynthesis
MMNGLISIIVPTHNSEKYLEDCINSILVQTYRNIEIIFVDDGSTDDTVAIVNNFMKNDNRVNLLQVPGCSATTARNAGMDIAQGDFICFVDSDDTIESDMYESMHKVLVASDADICICGLREVTADGRYETILPFEEKQSSTEFLEGYLKTPQKYAAFLYGGSTITLSRSHIFTSSKVRFDSLKLNNSGPEFNAKCIAAATKGICFLNRALYNWYSRGESNVTTLKPENIAISINAMGEVIKSTLPDKKEAIEDLIYNEYNTLLLVSAGRAKLRRIPNSFKLKWNTIVIVLKHSPSFFMKMNALCTYLLPGFCYRAVSAIALKLFTPYGRKKI